MAKTKKITSRTKKKSTEKRTVDKTNVQRQHRFQDQAASIDSELDDAIENINWERRNQAEKDIVTWTKTYCIGLLIDDIPSARGEEVLHKMGDSIEAHSNYAIAMGRGSGKSCFSLITTLFSILTGKTSFVVIFSHDHKAAQGMLNDIWRVVQSKDTELAQDYPQFFLPFHLLNGSVRRRQLYHGESTEIVKNSQTLSFPKIDGKQSHITTRGISSGCRGMRQGTLRPDFCILDDLQDSQSAENDEQVMKLYNIIKKDVIPLAGKTRISLLQTFTPIAPDDLVEKIKNDKSWKVSIFPAIIKYPKSMQQWSEYFRMYDSERSNDEPHDQSLSFYRQNFEQMNDGSEVFNPRMFDVKDGHISTLQKLLELKHDIGDAAFDAEYQMQPRKINVQLEITPKDILAKEDDDIARCVIPDGYTSVYASSDLNLSKYITTTICAYKPDGTTALLYHDFFKCNVDAKLPEAEYQAKTYEVLCKLGNELKNLDVKLDGWAIDCNGLPFQAVTTFSKKSVQICGIPCIGFVGKASHMFNESLKSRLRDGINQTVLCGDSREHVKAGSGAKWITWNSDHYRSLVQKQLKSPLGSIGGMSLYSGAKDEHVEFASQVCNEKLILSKQDISGRLKYFWKSKEPHDCLDSLAQNSALAASQGISGSNAIHDVKSNMTDKRKLLLARLYAAKNRKIKIV